MNPAGNTTDMAGGIVGFGAGGHAKVVLDILLGQHARPVIGLLDPLEALHGTTLMGVPVLGADSRIPDLRSLGATHFFLGIGASRSCALRVQVQAQAMAAGLLPVEAVHPTAWISPFATRGAGLTVMAQAAINAGAALGVHVVVNTGAVIEHDCRIGDFAYLAPRVLLLGQCEVGPQAFLGAGSVIRQGVSIGAQAVIGAGAVVLSDVPPFSTVVGNPARLLQPDRLR